MSEVLRSPYGSVRPYTRHVASCKHANEPRYNKCSCPKWIYTHKNDEAPKRYTLNTPSFAEALTIAADILKGFDPEIAELRGQKSKLENEKKTVEEAIELWLARTRSMFGEDASIVKQYRSTFGWRDKEKNAHGNFLLFVEQYNNKNPKQAIEFIQEITPLFCQQWHDSWNGKYSDYSRKQRWGTVRSFFGFLHGLGVIDTNPTARIQAAKASATFAHVPYTDDQYQRILDEADWYVDERVKDGEREVYTLRTRLFLELLRHTGMDLSDAVMFQTSLIKAEVVDRKRVQVLRYIRSKTDVEAIIVLKEELAERLNKIPLAPESFPDRPFRYRGNKRSSDAHNWSRRIAQLIKLAEIGKVQLINRDGTPAIDNQGRAVTRDPNVKMLRHTFAVGQLLKGLRPEVVAKQLGHVNTDMIYSHYAPWCRERDVAHIREQM